MSFPAVSTTATASAVGGGVAAVGVAAWLYRRLRPRFPVRVNCWFCQSDCRVDYARQNAWTCNECGQYNGFSRTGDYNWQDPDKFREVLPRPQPRWPQPVGHNHNGLCQSCNLNQSLKAHQLATFVPQREEHFDREVEAYAAHLERTYRLCAKCEAHLHQTLGQQDSWLRPKLLSWKLEFNRRLRQFSPSPLPSTSTSSPRGPANISLQITLMVLSLLTYLLVVTPTTNTATDALNVSLLLPLASALELSVGLLPLVTLSLACVMILCLFRTPSSSSPLLLGLLSCLWTGFLLALVLPRQLEDAVAVSLLPQHLAFWLAHICLAATLLHGFVWIKCSTPGHPTYSAAVRAAAIPPPSRPTSSATITPEYGTVGYDDDDDRRTQDLVSSHNSSIASSHGRWIKPSTFDVTSSVNHEHELSLKAAAPNNNLPHDLTRQSVPSASSRGGDLSSLSLVDDDDVDVEFELGCLSSGGEDRSTSPRPTSPFLLRSYDTRNNSGIDFGDGSHRRSTSQLLRPPKFNPSARNRVTKTSWVAGSYWNQSSSSSSTSGLRGRLPTVAMPSPSRASSQSSGFISQPNSRVNSVCGDNVGDDRFSVTSEVLGQPDRSMLSSSFKMDRLNDQLSFYDTSKKFMRGEKRLDHTFIETRTNSQASSNSFDSRLGRLTQDAFAGLQPKAESSPKHMAATTTTTTTKGKSSFLDKQINIQCTMHSVLLSSSLLFNISLVCYLMWHYA